jgi:hypothetical protein
MDLSKLSDADLMALKAGDLSKISTEGLVSLRPVEAQPTQSDFAETGGGAAVGRPARGVRLNVQETPRPLESFMAGVTKSAIDPVMAGAQLVTGGRGGVSEAVQRLAQEADQYSQANPASYMGGRIGGAVLPAAGIASGVGAAARGANMIPSFARANPYIQSAAVTGVAGGIQGGLTPVETGATGMPMYEEMGKDAAIGAAIGAPLGAIAPAVSALGSRVVQAGKGLVEPLYEQGQNRILGRFLRETAGGESAKAMRNLRAAQPLVAGSMPTAAEVAGVPSLAALQRTAVGISPASTNLVAARQQAQIEARANALRNIAPESRVSKYTDLRERVADDLYTDAIKPIDLGQITPKLTKEISSLTKTPAIKEAMSQAQVNAANKGMDIADPAGSMRGLHETKMALDGQIKAVKAKLERDAAGATSAELDGLNAAKTRLLGFIEQISPEYKTARVTYERLSKPVDQLESIAKLAKKSISPENEKIFVSRFSNDLQKVIDEGKLSERQLARLNLVKEDLARSKFAETAGKGVGSDTVQKLAYSNMMQTAGIPTALTGSAASGVLGNVASRTGDVLYGRANREMAQKLAEALMSPEDTLRLMRVGRPPNTAIDAKTRNDLARLLTIQGLQKSGEAISGEQ